LRFRPRPRFRRALFTLVALTALMFPLSPSAAKPRISITSPTSGNALSGVVKFTVSARSASKVKFYVDGRLLAIDRTRPYSTRLDTRRLWIGSHVLRALAVNRWGAVSDRVSVKVRNPGPDTTAPSAPTGLVVSDSAETRLSFSWASSSDNRGVAGYDVLLDGMKKSETTALNASLSDLACGEPYALGVRAFDAAGNRSTVSSIVSATSACGSGGGVEPGTSPPGTGTNGVNWFPGYYVLGSSTTFTAKQKILDDPLVAPFTGVQFRYQWSETELAEGDYTAGFAQLDADLESVAARSKKLLVMLQYKNHDGTAAVPSYLLSEGGPWCSGLYCGDLAYEDKHVAMVWNDAVSARLVAWVSAMAGHLAASPHASSVAGIVFNETSLPTVDHTLLAEAGYDPYAYMRGLQEDMLAAVAAAPRLPVFYYHEGGFVSMDGEAVHAGTVMGDWMLEHPHTGSGTSDLKPKDPKTATHPCANPSYQGRFPCNPDVQAGDYSVSVTDSLDQTFQYATGPAPLGLSASYLTFSYAVGSGPNAFTFEDVSRYILSHPTPNSSVPPGW
jgi:Bacterial Ig domain